ncbi:MAG: YcaO-like family protein [Acidobacteriota bacterium]
MTRLDHTEEFGVHVCDARYGIVQRICERRTLVSLDGLNEFIARAYLPLGSESSSADNGGRGERKSTAYCGAIGESIERYALSIYDPSTLTVAPFDAVEDRALSPDALRFFLDAQYRDPQFPFAPPQPTDHLAWIEGVDFVTGEATYVPASLVFLPYRHLDDEPRLSHQISPGASCHTSREAAALSAVLELVERDAFTIFWETAAAFPRVAPDPVFDEVLRASALDLDVDSFDISTDLEIPTALVLVRSTEGAHACLSYGMASRPTFAEAHHSAWQEAVTSWISARTMIRGERVPRDLLLERMAAAPGFHLHMLWSALGYADDDLRFVEDAAPRAPTRDLTAASGTILEAVREKLRDRGCRVILVDITPSDVAELGFFAMRAVSTDLVRQSLGFHCRHLRNERLTAVPKTLGLPHRHRTHRAIYENYRPEP